MNKLIECEETGLEFGTRIWEDYKGKRIIEKYDESTGLWKVQE